MRGLIRSNAKQAKTLLHWMLLASLLARSLIAPGFMPSPAVAEQILTLCHSGLTPAAIDRLFTPALTSGSENDTHPSHHSHHAAANRQAADAAESAIDSLSHDQLCPLGHALSTLFTLQLALDWVQVQSSSYLEQALVVDGWRATGTIGFLARAPPESLLTHKLSQH